MRVQTVVWRPLRVLLLLSSVPSLPSHYFSEAPLFPTINAQLETYTSSVGGYWVITEWGWGTVDGQAVPGPRTDAFPLP